MARSQDNLNAVFQDTANAIRAKKGSTNEICPRDFADEVASIQTGITPTGTLNITENDVYDVTNYASANVNIPGPSGTYNITSNDTYNISEYEYVHVQVSGGGGGFFDESLVIVPSPVVNATSTDDSFAGYINTIYIDSAGGVLAARDSNKVMLYNVGGYESGDNSYYELSDDGEGNISINWHPNGQSTGTPEETMKVYLPVPFGRYAQNCQIYVGGDATQAGLFLDGAESFGISTYGDCIVEFYDITGQYKIAEYTLNDMYKASAS